MKKTIPQKDYGTYERNVQLKIDESFAERYIPADDSVLDGAPAPSYFEIARFRSKRLATYADELFSQLVHYLHEIGEITFEHLFVDGTKIEANANKYSFVWKKSTNK